MSLSPKGKMSKGAIGRAMKEAVIGAKAGKAVAPKMSQRNSYKKALEGVKKKGGSSGVGVGY